MRNEFLVLNKKVKKKLLSSGFEGRGSRKKLYLEMNPGYSYGMFIMALSGYRKTPKSKDILQRTLEYLIGKEGN